MLEKRVNNLLCVKEVIVNDLHVVPIKVLILHLEKTKELRLDDPVRVVREDMLVKGTVVMNGPVTVGWMLNMGWRAMLAPNWKLC